MQRVVTNKPIPNGNGVLIFDEVKVVCHLMWNSRCHQLIGLAMNYEDLASVNDVCQLLLDDVKLISPFHVVEVLYT